MAEYAQAPTGIEAQVCNDIAERQRLGIAKYGTTVADNSLTQYEWLQHMYEELLDAAVYCRRMMEEHRHVFMGHEYPNNDTCKKCGLNLRNGIHKRWRE